MQAVEAVEREEDQEDQFDSQWMDAAEFFSTKHPAIPRHLMEDDFGCKRSSIIRIRRENRGMVSQSVETFTRPDMPPPKVVPPRHRQSMVATASSRGTPTVAAANRRMSARMGVSSATPVSGSTPLQSRRQTRTGIRTSVNHKHSIGVEKTRPPPPAQASRAKEASAPSVSANNSIDTIKSASVQPSIAANESRRRPPGIKSGARRHLTIGYAGEVRSPLSDRQNRTPSAATVQRSKSAQTPLQSKPAKRARPFSSASEQENKVTEMQQHHHPMVTRSQSMHSPSVRGGASKVTISLPEGSIAYGSGGKKMRRPRSERAATVVVGERVLLSTAKSPRAVKMY